MGEIIPGIHLVDGNALTLIDAGFPENLTTVTEYVKGFGMRLEQLRYILITHAHPADVRSNRKHHSVSYLGLDSSFLRLPFLRRAPTHGFLNDGDELPILGGLRSVHTPGHTPGSLCFHLEKAGVLFTSDLIIEHQGALGKNSHAFPGADQRDYQASLAKVASLGYDFLCPWHGKPVRGNATQQVRAFVEEDTSYELS